MVAISPADMNEKEKLEKVREILLMHKEKIKNEYKFPGAKESNDDIRSANIFFLGSIMDYQMDADIVWENAEELVDTLGPENLWHKIINMPEEKWVALRKKNKGYFHRFWEAKGNSSIAMRIRRIANNMVEKFNGDPRNIWKNKTAEEVYKILKNGVEVNLSNSDATIHMIVLALGENGIIKGLTNVKPAAHVKKVLGRIFFGEIIKKDNEAIELARKIYPENPGKIDLPLFDIGKNICRKNEPKCGECPINNFCNYYTNLK